jgi:hypothetical protein
MAAAESAPHRLALRVGDHHDGIGQEPGRNHLVAQDMAFKSVNTIPGMQRRLDQIELSSASSDGRRCLADNVLCVPRGIRFCSLR